MFYILYNEKNNKVVVTPDEERMFDLLIGDCVMVGNVKHKKEIENKVFEFWHNEITENQEGCDVYELA